MKIENLRRPDRRFDPVCHCCDTRLAPVIFTPTAKRADDLHLDCDVCGDPVCAECAEEDDGVVTCSACIDQQLIDAQRERAEDHHSDKE